MTDAPTVAGQEVLLGNPANPEMIKGKMLAAHMNWLRERLGPGATLLPLWAALPEGTRERLQAPIDPNAWYSFADVVHLDRAIMSITGNGTLAALGRYSADKNIPVYAIDGDAHRFLSLHAVLHSSFQNFGKAVYRSGDDCGRIEITGYTAYSPVFCASAPAFFHRVLERFGYIDIEVRERECHCRGDARCVFELKWRGAPVRVKNSGSTSASALSARCA
jgi:hypothetical protein